MINISLILRNPWCKTWKIIKSKNFLISKHKSIELNFYKTAHIIAIEFDAKINCDHAGIRFLIGILFYDFEFNFYDNRHL
jgi:hypothetical protein